MNNKNNTAAGSKLTKKDLKVGDIVMTSVGSSYTIYEISMIKGMGGLCKSPIKSSRGNFLKGTYPIYAHESFTRVEA